MVSKSLFTLCLIVLSFSSVMSESVVDYCVADLSLPKGPAGYPCKNPANLTVNDFVFSGLGVPADTNNILNLGTTFAIDETFPAFNGLGLSMVRLDIGVNGVVPVHSHRVSEVIIVIKGTIIAGFIDSNNTPFYKTLKKGDIMIFPQSLLHFQVNIGKVPALCFVSLNSPNPGFQFTSTSLFGNGLPTKVVEKISLINAMEVKRLKKILGGSN